MFLEHLASDNGADMHKYNTLYTARYVACFDTRIPRNTEKDRQPPYTPWTLPVFYHMLLNRFIPCEHLIPSDNLLGSV